MFSRISTCQSTESYSEKTSRLKEWLNRAESVVIGAGAGLSASAGFTYGGRRFEDNFADFSAKYHFHDMYTGGFYPFESPEERWAYWSRYIMINRFTPPPKPVYEELLELVKDKDYFVITTNVDHCFQRAGFDKERLFYTQGDYGLWQCSGPCRQQTYDNEEAVRRMAAEQREMKIPSKLIPHCLHCGRPMAMNLRADDSFVQDQGWYRAARRYEAFLERCQGRRLLLLELGVGMNTPGIVKYPFWRMAAQNPQAFYVCLNPKRSFLPRQIADRSLCLERDAGQVLEELLES